MTGSDWDDELEQDELEQAANDQFDQETETQKEDTSVSGG